VLSGGAGISRAAKGAEKSVICWPEVLTEFDMVEVRLRDDGGVFHWPSSEFSRRAFFCGSCSCSSLRLASR
jgi:hypothetical protein